MSITKKRTLEYIEQEWGTYVERFERLPRAEQEKRVREQGYERFRDLLAHILAWWEEGARVISGILDSPSFTWEPSDVDAFNREQIQKYSTWLNDDLFRHYESVRLAMLDLAANLPNDAFSNDDIEGWLMDDVVEHYDEHPIPV